MSKRLVVCCDGTWNTPDQMTDGTPTRTNVAKIALAVSETGQDGRAQQVCYLRGVGTNRWDRLRGGAFGVGLSDNVKDAYRFIVANYEPGDELFLLGFSRGAFTARSAAGLVRNAGVLKPGHADRVDAAFDLYRDRARHPRGTESKLFRRSYSVEAGIRFIGVWDTVGALGVPLTGNPVADAVNRRWQFHDTTLSSTVEGAFQALAIDERRKAFRPTLWQRSPEATDQRLEQVWFSGVHCDVGGGYPQTGLSDIALLWMAERAAEFGLGITPGALDADGSDGQDPVVPDPLGPLHDSRTALYKLQAPYLRPLGEGDPSSESAASSAVARRDGDPGYRAPNLDAYLARPGATVTPVPA